MGTIRLLEVADAPVLAALLTDNDAFLAPWQPSRPDSFRTVDGQRDAIGSMLRAYRKGAMMPYAILDTSGHLVGRITLNRIYRGYFQSASVSYWVAAAVNGRGLATAAVREMVSLAFGELRLHRVQAATLPHNAASRRVLERTGFVRIGTAPGYLRIAGRWQDHVLYQRLRPEPPPASGV